MSTIAIAPMSRPLKVRIARYINHLLATRNPRLQLAGGTDRLSALPVRIIHLVATPTARECPENYARHTIRPADTVARAFVVTLMFECASPPTGIARPPVGNRGANREIFAHTACCE